jgi:hypothetical protein
MEKYIYFKLPKTSISQIVTDALNSAFTGSAHPGITTIGEVRFSYVKESIISDSKEGTIEGILNVSGVLIEENGFVGMNVDIRNTPFDCNNAAECVKEPFSKGKKIYPTENILFRVPFF